MDRPLRVVVAAVILCLAALLAGQAHRDRQRSQRHPAGLGRSPPSPGGGALPTTAPAD